MAKALLVCDAQRIYTDPDSELYCEDSTATIDRINSLIAKSENQHDLIVLIRHQHKLDGSDLGRLFDYTGIPDEDFNFKEGSDEVTFDTRLYRPRQATEIIKTRYSAFARTDLDAKMRNSGVDTVIICGFMTNFCCDSTARAALDLDYYVDFVVDATGTPGTEGMSEPEIRKVVGDLLAAGIAQVFNTDAYLAR